MTIIGPRVFVRILIFTSLLSAQSTILFASPQEVQPTEITMEQIRERFRERLARIETINISYTGKYSDFNYVHEPHMDAPFRQALENPRTHSDFIDKYVPDPPNVLKDQVTLLTDLKSFRRDRTYERLNTFSGGIYPGRTERIRDLDGYSLTFHAADAFANGGVQIRRLRPRPFPVLTSSATPFRWTLTDDWLAFDVIRVIREEMYEGRPCVVIGWDNFDRRPAISARMEVFLDLERDFVPILYRTFRRDGELRKSVDVQYDPHELAGYVPKKIINLWTGSLLLDDIYLKEWTVTSVIVNEELPRSWTEIDIPDGTKVRDYRNDRNNPYTYIYRKKSSARRDSAFAVSYESPLVIDIALGQKKLQPDNVFPISLAESQIEELQLCEIR